MKTRLPVSALSISFALFSSLLVGCANLNDPYSQGGYGNYGAPYGGGGYNAPYGGYNSQPYYGGPGYYNGYPNYQQQQQRELDRERRELDRERERLERERDSYRAPPPPAPRPAQDRCPPGFSPSENKCSPQERRNGCRDIRLPSGLGCVSR